MAAIGSGEGLLPLAAWLEEKPCRGDRGLDPPPFGRAWARAVLLEHSVLDVSRALKCWVVAGMLLASNASAVATGDGEPPDPEAPGLTLSERLVVLVARSAWEHARLETLEAAFVQRKESNLLLEPETSAGVFVYRAPNVMRWDFTPPTSMTIVIRDQAMITWYRDLNRVERVDVGRRADKILRLLGPGASLAELQRYFTLTVEFPKVAEEPYRVRLEPRSARIGRRVRSMDMELDRQLFVPTFLRFVDPDGGAIELRFEDLRINGDMPPDRFELDLPEDIEASVARSPS